MREQLSFLLNRIDLSRLILMKLIIVTAILLNYNLCLSQEVNKPILIKKNFWGTKYWQDGKKISPKSVFKIVSSTEEGAVEIKMARKKNRISSLIGFPGAVLSGVYLEGLVKGHVTNVIPVGVGVALIFTSYPYGKSGQRHINKAIDIYNNSLKELNKEF